MSSYISRKQEKNTRNTIFIQLFPSFTLASPKIQFLVGQDLFLFKESWEKSNFSGITSADEIVGQC